MSAVDDPRRLPELRADLLAGCDSQAWLNTERERVLGDMVGGGVVERMGDHGQDAVISGPLGFNAEQIRLLPAVADARARKALGWFRTTLSEAQLIYVAPDLVDVVADVAQRIPLDAVAAQGDAPATHGFVVFGSPLYGVDANHEGTIRLDALAWGPSLLPPSAAWWDGDEGAEAGVEAWTFGWWRWLHPDHTDALAEIAPPGGQWVPIGRSDWPFGFPLGRAVYDGQDWPIDSDPPAAAVVDGQKHASMIDDRKLVTALWLVLNERRLVQSETVMAPRAAQRRLERKGRPSPSVTVIHLRRTQQHPGTSPGEGRKVSVRFVVRAHPRWQACGPGRTQRRLVLVPAHVKGPVDAPLVHGERVWSLDR